MPAYQTNGALSLEEQRRAIRAEELRGPYKLVGLTKGASKPFNKVTLEDAGLGEDVPDLVLIEVANDEALAQIRADQEAESREMVCYSIIYVSGKETGVAAFR